MSQADVPVEGNTGGHILLYHRVATLAPDTHRLCTGPAVFRQHMKHLQRHWRPIELADLIRATHAGHIPRRAVVVTFDDGYADNLYVASPILMESGIPATFFVSSERLWEKHEWWWDLVERILLGPHTVPSVLPLTIEGQHVEYCTATVDDRRKTLMEVHGVLMYASYDNRERLMQDIVDWTGRTWQPRESHRCLLDRELRELATRRGHSIGSHTTHHLLLPEHPVDVQRQEIRENKAILEDVVHRRVAHFSYPYGEMDGQTVEEVRKASFSAAVTVKTGVVRRGVEVFALPRLDVGDMIEGVFVEMLSRYEEY